MGRVVPPVNVRESMSVLAEVNRLIYHSAQLTAVELAASNETIPQPWAPMVALTCAAVDAAVRVADAEALHLLRTLRPGVAELMRAAAQGIDVGAVARPLLDHALRSTSMLDVRERERGKRERGKREGGERERGTGGKGARGKGAQERERMKGSTGKGARGKGRRHAGADDAHAYTRSHARARSPPSSRCCGTSASRRARATCWCAPSCSSCRRPSTASALSPLQPRPTTWAPRTGRTRSIGSLASSSTSRVVRLAPSRPPPSQCVPWPVLTRVWVLSRTQPNRRRHHGQGACALCPNRPVAARPRRPRQRQRVWVRSRGR